MATTKQTPTTTTTATTATTSDSAAGAAWLTKDEFAILEAICDTFIPAVAPPTPGDDPDGYYARKASDLEVASKMAGLISDSGPQDMADFKTVLKVIKSPIFGLLTLGRPQGFMKMAPATRERAIRAMASSSIAPLRSIFQALKRSVAVVYFGVPDAKRFNPNWPTLDYTAPPPPPSPDAFPKRIHTVPVDGDLSLAADVVIIGSGAGGGMTAALLAAAGKDVLIIEKGGYYNESDFNGIEAEMLPKLYLKRGALATKDLSMIVLAGSTLGGGTILNFSTSLRTPDYVLDEWEREYGVTDITAPEYQAGLDEATQRLHIGVTESIPNANNAALRDGCKSLNYDWRPIPRNALGCQQRCGACASGCAYGCKQSSMITYIQDAHDKGARVLVDCDIRRITLANGAATGVEGWATNRTTGERHSVSVRAPVVIVACGAVESPALLARSGVNNPNIGKHLRLHPCSVMMAEHPEPIYPWIGAPQTIFANQFTRAKGNYGTWIEAANAHPGLLGFVLPWESGKGFKQEMQRISRLAVMMALVRDTGEGSVTLDRSGNPVLNYFPNKADQDNLILGMREMVRISLASGAISTVGLQIPAARFETDNHKPGAYTEKRLNDFLDQLSVRGVRPNMPSLVSAHPMGTARMGGSAKIGVADPYGKVWGVRGLYVADGSLMPSAPGVNPMLSIYAMAYRVGTHLIAEGK